MIRHRATKTTARYKKGQFVSKRYWARYGKKFGTAKRVRVLTHMERLTKEAKEKLARVQKPEQVTKELEDLIRRTAKEYADDSTIATDLDWDAAEVNFDRIEPIAVVQVPVLLPSSKGSPLASFNVDFESWIEPADEPDVEMDVTYE